MSEIEKEKQQKAEIRSQKSEQGESHKASIRHHMAGSRRQKAEIKSQKSKRDANRTQISNIR